MSDEGYRVILLTSRWSYSAMGYSKVVCKIIVVAYTVPEYLHAAEVHCCRHAFSRLTGTIPVISVQNTLLLYLVFTRVWLCRLIPYQM